MRDLGKSAAIVELFYIQRTSREGDKWSGHVAFPGGKKEQTDCDDQATAARESLEEVGFDLTSSDFLYLGCLDDRPVTSGGHVIPGFFMAPLVWLQISAETPSVRMQTSEVAAWRWVPLSYLDPALVTYDVVRKEVKYGFKRLPFLPKGLRAMTSYPSIQLYVRAPSCTSNAEAQFTLWGLTLHATSDALVIGGGHDRQLGWPPLSFQWTSANWLVGAVCAMYAMRHPRTHRLLGRHVWALASVVGIAILCIALCGRAALSCKRRMV